MTACLFVVILRRKYTQRYDKHLYKVTTCIYLSLTSARAANAFCDVRALNADKVCKDKVEINPVLIVIS